METILTSVLGIIAVWSFALAIATVRMIYTVYKGKGKPRKSDWVQLVGTLLVSCISGGALIMTPSIAAINSGGLIALELGAVVLLEYITERVVLCCRGIKQRFTNPS